MAYLLPLVDRKGSELPFSSLLERTEKGMDKPNWNPSFLKWKLRRKKNQSLGHFGAILELKKLLAEWKEKMQKKRKMKRMLD